MQNRPDHHIARRDRSARRAPQFWPTIAPIEPDSASRGTTAKLCNRPAAPKPATADSPWLASSAVSTERPIGLIALEKAAGPATDRIALLDAPTSQSRIAAGWICNCAPLISHRATRMAMKNPAIVA